VQRSLGDVIDVISSKQQCKSFVINDSFIVLARAFCENHQSSVIAEKNVIDAVRSEGNLNQIEVYGGR